MRESVDYIGVESRLYYLVFCAGNKLPEFGRRVARLARRHRPGQVDERGQRWETG